MRYWGTIYRKLLCRQEQRGFTLIELLVVTAIIGILIGISTTVFIGILRSQNKTNVINEVRQNAIHAIDLFERDIRDAESVEIPELPLPPETNIVTIHKIDFTTIVWTCTDAIGGNNGVFTRKVDLGTDEKITNTDTIYGVDIDCDEEDGTAAFLVSGNAESTIIKLDFTAKQGVDAPTRNDFNVEIKFETTVGTREF